jgi:glycosyltransferase involved in cell wall biosynthesis
MEIQILENNPTFSHDDEVLIDTDFIPLVSVIIPIYNEEESIQTLVTRLNEVASKNWEILFIDDGSTDSTYQVLSGIIGEKMKLLKHPKNLGKGAAIKTGLNQANGHVVIIQDADLEYDPGEITKMVSPILNRESEVVFGSRFLNGKINGMSLTHLIGNRVLSRTASVLFGEKVSDIMTGHKAFRKEIISPEQINCSGFEFEVELTHKFTSNGFKYLEIPIAYNKRMNGKAKISKIDGFKGLIRIFKCLVNSS